MKRRRSNTEARMGASERAFLPMICCGMRYKHHGERSQYMGSRYKDACIVKRRRIASYIKPFMY